MIWLLLLVLALVGLFAFFYLRWPAYEAARYEDASLLRVTSVYRSSSGICLTTRDPSERVATWWLWASSPNEAEAGGDRRMRREDFDRLLNDFENSQGAS